VSSTNHHTVVAVAIDANFDDSTDVMVRVTVVVWRREPSASPRRDGACGDRTR
jgi:hypothetical protein